MASILAIVGLILGGASLLAVVTLLFLLLGQQKRIHTLERAFSVALDEDGKLRSDSAPQDLVLKVKEVSSKVQDVERIAKRSKEGVQDIREQLHSLLDKISKREAGRGPDQSSSFGSSDGPTTRTSEVARTPGAQPLQMFVEQQISNESTKKPSPVFMGSTPLNEEKQQEVSAPQGKNSRGSNGAASAARTTEDSPEGPDDVMVRADIGFGESSSRYQPAVIGHQHQAIWSASTSKNDFRIVPLLPVQTISPAEEVRGGVSTHSDPLSFLAPLPATPTLANRSLDFVKSSPGMSVNSSPGNVSSRNKRQGAYGMHGIPLSARGINPEKHPELHAKEMAEMGKLVQLHCHDSAVVETRTSIKCLWCHQSFSCPPYRPQSFFFKDVHNSGEHDGHYYCCSANPNNSLQAGRGVNVGDGKVLI